MSLKFTPTTSTEAQTCFRCLQLGLPPYGIMAGDQYMHAKSETAEAIACEDCIDRMLEELKSIQD